MGVRKVSSCKYIKHQRLLSWIIIYFTIPVVWEMLILSRLHSNDWNEFKYPLRMPLKLNLSNISMIKQLSLTIRLSLVCCSLGHMIAYTVRLAASQLSKINRPIFFWFQTVCSYKTQVTAEKTLSPIWGTIWYSWRKPHTLQHHWKKVR